MKRKKHETCRMCDSELNNCKYRLMLIHRIHHTFFLSVFIQIKIKGQCLITEVA